MVRQCVCVCVWGHVAVERSSRRLLLHFVCYRARERERETLWGFGKSKKYKVATLAEKERQLKERRQRLIGDERWKAKESLPEWSLSFLLVLIQFVSTRQKLIVSWFLLYWFVEHEVWLNIDERTRGQRKTEHVKEVYVYVKWISPVLRDKVESLLFFLFVSSL